MLVSSSTFADFFDPGGGGGSGDWISWSTGYSSQTYFINPSGGSIYMRYLHGTGLKNPTTEQVEITAVEFQIWSSWDPAVSYSYEIQVYYNGDLKETRTGSMDDPSTTYSTFYFAGFNYIADYDDLLYLRAFVWVTEYSRSTSECVNVLVEYVP